MSPTQSPTKSNAPLGCGLTFLITVVLVVIISTVEKTYPAFPEWFFGIMIVGLIILGIVFLVLHLFVRRLNQLMLKAEENRSKLEQQLNKLQKEGKIDEQQ